MRGSFSEVKLFQVKPDALAEFEELIPHMAEAQRQRPGCLDVKYFKRFYTIDGVEMGGPPRALTRIIKCVKYYSYWEFDGKENYGKAVEWYFAEHAKIVQKLLLMPFDIHCGDTLY